MFDGPAKTALIVGLQSILLSDGEVLQESQKPYRVFVSLLDEWDIGYPVIQAVFLDALQSLKRHVDAGNHGAEVMNYSNNAQLCIKNDTHTKIVSSLECLADSNSYHVDRHDGPISHLEKAVRGSARQLPRRVRQGAICAGPGYLLP